jgi:exodeoxyribonuclease III
MKIFSWNVNGIRASYPKGLGDFMVSEYPGILCLQEIKAKEEQFPENLLAIPGYHLTVNSAQKPGYAGVAVFSKEKPRSVVTKIGYERFDSEGRILLCEFKEFTLLNLYLPHGGRQKENLEYKLEVYKKILKLLGELKDKPVVVCGDFNIAHTELDLARPKGNQNNIMFTPEERSQLDKVEALGYVDSLRMFHPEGELYSWWPYAFDARKRNIGWRIDYLFVSPPLVAKLKDGFVRPDIMGSDHGPVGIELN